MHVMGLPKGWVLRRGTCNSIEFDRFNFRLDPGRAEQDCELFVSQVKNSVSGEVKTEGAPIYALM